MKNMCADLAEEQSELDAFVADLDEDGWDTRTPAEGMDRQRPNSALGPIMKKEHGWRLLIRNSLNGGWPRSSKIRIDFGNILRKQERT